MKRGGWVLSALLVCGATVARSQGSSLFTRRAKSEVFAATTSVLARAGFDVVQSDAAAGLLSLERKGSPKAFGSALKCKWPTNSMASTMGETSFRLSLIVVPADSGSAVTVNTKTRTDYSRTIGPFKNTPASDTDCVSTGVFERLLSDSLAAGAK